MAFPPHTPILDTFTDASAPQALPTYNSLWRTGRINAVTALFTVVGGGAGTGGASSGGSMWTAVFGVNTEVYATMKVNPGGIDTFVLYLRAAYIPTVGGTPTPKFYSLTYATLTDDWTVRRGSTTLATIGTRKINNGDSWGAAISGNPPIITGFWIPSTGAGGWTQVGSVTDVSFGGGPPYPGPGFIGIDISSTTGQISAFGGGVLDQLDAYGLPELGRGPA